MEKTELSIEEKILEKFRNVAVVGLSENPEKPSYGIAKYLAEHGYNIIPVNPTVPEILGRQSYPDLISVPEKVEVVEIFRRPETVVPIVEEAIEVGAKVVWMQEGIVNEEAAARAREAGLLVVMDKCMFKEHQRITEENQKRNKR